MESYGLSVHKKKPFLCSGGIFLEVYGEGFPLAFQKSCQKLGNLFHALTAPNIAAAKERFSASFDALEPDFRKEGLNILHWIISCWGYEFSPDEYLVPYQLGGWIRDVAPNGLDNLFRNIGELENRHLPFLKLLSVKRNLPRGLPKTKAKFSHVLESAKKRFKPLISNKPPSLDYAGLVMTALSSQRASKQQEWRSWHDYLSRRKEAFTTKGYLPFSQIPKIYWEKVMSEGRGYNPPYSAVHGSETIPPLGDPLEDGIYDPKGAPWLRCFFTLCQELGTLSKEFTFWLPYSHHGVNNLWYEIVCSLGYQGIRLTPRTIQLLMVIGERNTREILWESVSMTGKFSLSWDFEILDEIILSFGKANLDKQIYVDHVLREVILTPFEEAGGFEIFRIQQVLVDQINTLVSQDEVLAGQIPAIANWDHLRELLGDTAKKKREMSPFILFSPKGSILTPPTNNPAWHISYTK